MTIFTFALFSTLWPSSESLVNPNSIDMHPFGSVSECMCVCAYTLPCSHGTAWHANTLHMSFQSDPSVFWPPYGGEREPEGGKRARRGVSQANTKGYCTHSPLNIKDSSNCSTLLSGSSGTVGHLIHLTLGMSENGFSGDGEPFGTNVATLYCG